MQHSRIVVAIVAVCVIAAVAAFFASTAHRVASIERAALEGAVAGVRAARAAALDDGVASAPSGAAESRAAATFANVATGALAGRVADASGRPLEGVRVELHADSLEAGGLVDPAQLEGLDLVAATTTDARGAFRIDTAPALCCYYLDLAREGFAEARRNPIAIVAGQTLELQPFVLYAEAQVAGLVTDEQGHPAKGARVIVGGSPEEDDLAVDDVGFHERETATDERGRFRLARLPTGSVSLSAKAESPQRDADVVRVRLIEGREVEAPTLVLRPSRTIRGVVTSADGAPIADASVQPSGGWEATFWSGAGTWTGPSGAFVLEGLPAIGSIRLDVAHPAFRSTTLRDVEPGGEPLRIRLAAHSRVELAVVDAESGAPVTANWIWIETPNGLSSPMEPRALAAGAAPADRIRVPLEERRAVRLRVGAEGYAPSDAITVEADGRTSFGPITVALHRAPVLRCRVVHRGTDRPIAFVDVRAEAEGGADGADAGADERHAAALRLACAQTDAEGLAVLTLPSAGRYVVRVETNEVWPYPATRADAPLAKDAEPLRVEVPIAGIVSGIVRDGARASAPGVLVSAVRADAPDRTKQVQCGPAGAFWIGGLAPGRWHVGFSTLANPDGGAPVDAEARGWRLVEVIGGRVTACELDLAPLGVGAIEGTVAGSQGFALTAILDRLHETGAPDEFSAFPQLTSSSDEAVARDGSFRFGAVWPGRYRVSLKSTRFDEWVVATQTIDVAAGAPTRVTLRLPAEELRVAAVWKTDGSPAARCLVRAYTKTENFDDAVVIGAARTDSDGIARLRFLPAGELVVRVDPESGISKNVNASAPGTPLRVEVERGGSIHYETETDAEIVAADETLERIEGETRTHAWHRRGWTGHIVGIKPGRYLLTVKGLLADGTAIVQGTMEFEAREGEEKRATVALKPIR